MLIRASILFLFTSILLGANAHACTLSPDTRSSAVADYVGGALPCLADMPAGFTADSIMELGFLSRINEARSQGGLPVVSLRPQLTDGARFHSLDMSANKFFGHSGPDERHPSDRISAFDRSALIEYASENVAMMEVVQGYFDFDGKALNHLHQELMDSPPHKKNILNPDATHVAIGVVRTEHGVWVTQLFLGLTGTLSRDAPLRLTAGEMIELEAELNDWTFKDFEAEQDGQAPKVFQLRGALYETPLDLNGDFQLSAHSERKGSQPRTTHTIHFAGPSITAGH